tara:strand:+ start:1208 stop:1408 length:201 start_codon:yes stop_codon:yes gene_type:complete
MDCGQKLYGWFSLKQRNLIKKPIFYSDISGNVVEVTSVNGSNFLTESKFDDIICIGVVVRYIPIKD